MISGNTPATDSADRLAELTSRYARYSRSAGGLGLVIGGVLCLRDELGLSAASDNA